MIRFGPSCESITAPLKRYPIVDRSRGQFTLHFADHNGIPISRLMCKYIITEKEGAELYDELLKKFEGRQIDERCQDEIVCFIKERFGIDE